MSRLPKFVAPPVVETVLGTQFMPFKASVTPYAGLFWKEYLGKEWTEAKEAPPIDDVFERFGDERVWGQPGVRFSPMMPSPRLQFIRDDEERMVQIQNTRFIYNWRKRGGDYPTYDILMPEFQERYEQFKKFARETELGDIALNQWEVTYVNHIPSGKLWNSPSDWDDIFPDFYIPAKSVSGQRIENISTEWRVILGSDRGRLHISLAVGRLSTSQGPDALILKFSARGPVDAEKGFDLQGGFDLGHEAIVQTFDAMTSAKAHKVWEKKP